VANRVRSLAIARLDGLAEPSVLTNGVSSAMTPPCRTPHQAVGMGGVAKKAGAAEDGGAVNLACNRTDGLQEPSGLNCLRRTLGDDLPKLPVPHRASAAADTTRWPLSFD
jgi:hypothetical protein